MLVPASAASRTESSAAVTADGSRLLRSSATAWAWSRSRPGSTVKTSRASAGDTCRFTPTTTRSPSAARGGALACIESGWFAQELSDD